MCISLVLSWSYISMRVFVLAFVLYRYKCFCLGLCVMSWPLSLLLLLFELILALTLALTCCAMWSTWHVKKNVCGVVFWGFGETLKTKGRSAVLKWHIRSTKWHDSACFWYALYIEKKGLFFHYAIFSLFCQMFCCKQTAAGLV